MTPAFEFEPFPRGLYTADALLDGFDPDRPATYANMRDTLIYAEFVRGGGAACGDYLTAMSRALHDNGITQALADEMASAKIVAIMGGHIGARGDDVYADTARIAASLAAAGFTIASGGGPGIMEAAHLGAAFAGDSGLEDALKELGAPAVPKAIPANAAHLIAADGSIDTAIAEALGTYLAPAVRVLRALGHGGGLGIPTWLYGHEPTPGRQHREVLPEQHPRRWPARYSNVRHHLHERRRRHPTGGVPGRSSELLQNVPDRAWQNRRIQPDGILRRLLDRSEAGADQAGP
jgi:hypothetical protein